MYANRLSQASSNSDYPSSLSTFRNSALGLTDSPLIVMATASTPSTPSSSLHRRPLRERKPPSRRDLRQAVSSSSLRPIPESLSRPDTSPRPPSPGPPTPAKQSSVITSRAFERTHATSQPKYRPTSVNTARPPSQNKIHRKPPPASPAVSSDQWEAELIQGARNLQVSDRGGTSSRTSKEQLREEQRKKDSEWEKGGMWENQLNAAREAEDRTRRDAGRAIAYPPMQPRVPIRAATTGVTSVHIGVRPRLHPSLSESSLQRNQPDYSVPAPLFSPDSENRMSPRDAGIYDKAQKEYEDWLSKKKEREGGMDMEDNGYGTRDWVPRDRVVARPTALQIPSGSNLSVTPTQRVLLQEPAGKPIAPQVTSQTAGATLRPPTSHATAPSSAGSDDSTRATTPQELPSQQWGYDPYQMHQGWYDPSMYQQNWDPVAYQQYWAYMQGQGMTEEGRSHFEGIQANMDSNAYDPILCSRLPISYPNSSPMFGVSPAPQHAALPMMGGVGQAGMGGYQQPMGPTTPYGGIGFGLGQSGIGGGAGISMLGGPMGQMGPMGGMGTMNAMGMRGMTSVTGMQSVPGMRGGLGAMHTMPGGMGGMQMGGMGMSGMSGGGLGNLAGQGAGLTRWGGGAQNMTNGNMMMFNPYMMGQMQGQGGYPGMGGVGYNPMMGMMGGRNSMTPTAGVVQPAGPAGHGGEEMKLYDSTQMKRGRNGHYGYLEGRELAGPPVGYLPAGMQQPQQAQQAQSQQSSPIRAGTVAPPSMTGYPASASYATSAHTPLPAPSATASQRGAWADPTRGPPARYDGASSTAKYIQADLDTPYPQTPGGGATSAWTRFGADNEIINGIDGRMGMNIRKFREGRV